MLIEKYQASRGLSAIAELLVFKIVKRTLRPDLCLRMEMSTFLQSNLMSTLQ